MQPQPNAKITETPVFTMWLDELGILCFLSKKHPPQTLKVSKMLFAEIKKISQGHKRCMLMDLTNFQLPTKESRDYGAVELPMMTTAISFLSSSALGAWVANVFFTLKKQSYPTKIFTDEQEARNWLKKYL